MIATLLTVFTAGLLGGAVAANVTAVVVLAGIALALIGIVNGTRNLIRLCDLRH